MNAIDTNILIYAHDPRDPRKQKIAQELIRGLADGVLLWQVACEFMSAARKLEPMGFDAAIAWKVVAGLRSVWKPMLPAWSTLDRSIEMRTRYSLSFWDSLIVAGCIDGGIARIYSEDLGGSADLDGLVVENPFTR